MNEEQNESNEKRAEKIIAVLKEHYGYHPLDTLIQMKADLTKDDIFEMLMQAISMVGMAAKENHEYDSPEEALIYINSVANELMDMFSEKQSDTDRIFDSKLYTTNIFGNS